MNINITVYLCLHTYSICYMHMWSSTRQNFHWHVYFIFISFFFCFLFYTNAALCLCSQRWTSFLISYAKQKKFSASNKRAFLALSNCTAQHSATVTQAALKKCIKLCSLLLASHCSLSVVVNWPENLLNLYRTKSFRTIKCVYL